MRNVIKLIREWLDEEVETRVIMNRVMVVMIYLLMMLFWFGVLQEVQKAFGAPLGDPTDLFYGQSTLSPCHHPDFPPALAVDGSSGTFFLGTPSCSSPGRIIVVTLASPTTITNVFLRQGTAGADYVDAVHSVEVFASNDAGGAWADLGEYLLDVEAGSDSFAIDAGVIGAYSWYKFVGGSSDNNYWNLRDLEGYFEGVPTATPNTDATSTSVAGTATAGAAATATQGAIQTATSAAATATHLTGATATSYVATSTAAAQATATSIIATSTAAAEETEVAATETAIAVATYVGVGGQPCGYGEYPPCHVYWLTPGPVFILTPVPVFALTPLPVEITGTVEITGHVIIDNFPTPWPSPTLVGGTSAFHTAVSVAQGTQGPAPAGGSLTGVQGVVYSSYGNTTFLGYVETDLGCPLDWPAVNTRFCFKYQELVMNLGPIAIPTWPFTAVLFTLVIGFLRKR